MTEPPIRRQLLLAHQIQQLLDSKKAKDLKQIGTWLSVSNTRLHQLMNLLYLCPKIQEEIIFGDAHPLAAIGERTFRPLAKETTWEKQLANWNILFN